MYENQKTLECVQTKMFSAYGEKVHRGKIQLECRHEETSIKIFLNATKFNTKLFASYSYAK